MSLKRKSTFMLVVVALIAGAGVVRAADPAYWSWAQTPPMGWNSWDGFATTVTEAQTRAQADFMAHTLHQHGWQYIVVDIQWYEPKATGFDYHKGAKLEMDEWCRLLPATNKFPSAAAGRGFKPLADYVHSLGLKFGVHLMRGIPRQAVNARTPIKGTSYTAADIADTNNTCRWNSDMYGVDMMKPGAQEYYNSVFDQFAAWDLDFIKVDDLSRPYHQPEIEAIRNAIDRTGRAIVFSTSPGATPLSAGESVSTHANMWRISDDFWDDWKLLFEQFTRVRDWTPFRGPGHWPDADMLPIGVLQMGRNKTHFTHDEQITLMSLWSIARSPLMIGADLTKLDDFTLSLLTNDEVMRRGPKTVPTTANYLATMVFTHGSPTCRVRRTNILRYSIRVSGRLARHQPMRPTFQLLCRWKYRGLASPAPPTSGTSGRTRTLVQSPMNSRRSSTATARDFTVCRRPSDYPPPPNVMARPKNRRGISRLAFLQIIAFTALLVATAGAESGDTNSLQRTVTIQAVVPPGSGMVYLAGNVPELGPWDPQKFAMNGHGTNRIAVLHLYRGHKSGIQVHPRFLGIRGNDQLG